jgi:hypothetical protein
MPDGYNYVYKWSYAEMLQYCLLTFPYMEDGLRKSLAFKMFRDAVPHWPYTELEIAAIKQEISDTGDATHVA